MKINNIDIKEINGEYMMNSLNVTNTVISLLDQYKLRENVNYIIPKDYIGQPIKYQRSPSQEGG